MQRKRIINKSNKEKTPTIAFRISPEIYKKLRVITNDRGISMSLLMDEVVQFYFKDKR